MISDIMNVPNHSALSDKENIMNYNEAYALLEKHSQTHLLDFYNELDPDSQNKLLEQIGDLDFSLLSLKKCDTSSARGHLEPLGAITVEQIDARRGEFEQAGLKALRENKIGAVLLAGGQGTRLGFDKPKGCFNVGVTRDLYIFECLINNMLDTVRLCGSFFPLYIMTSEINHDDTVKFFEEHSYFGYDKSRVSFFKQEMAPSVDFNGKILLQDKGRISLSPNGNGGWFSSLSKAGYLDQLKAQGVEWLSLFSVDNVLQRVNDPAFVGATLLSGTPCGAKVIRKNSPEEKIGVMCLEDGKPSIVEYYEITEDMRNLRDEKGGLLYSFGVILNYLFRIDALEEATRTPLAYHIVEKKIPCIDAAGNSIRPQAPNGLKFERLTVDLIHLLDSCLPYEIVRNYEFAPVKNPTGVDSVESARELLELNGVKL